MVPSEKLLDHRNLRKKIGIDRSRSYLIDCAPNFDPSCRWNHGKWLDLVGIFGIFNFFPYCNPGTNMCVCIDIYTIFFSYPIPPMPHPTCPTPSAPPPPPPHPNTWGWEGRVGRWGGGIWKEYRVYMKSSDFFPTVILYPNNGKS